MNIKIVRYRKKLACTEQGRSDAIDGQLYIEGMRICDCAENAKSAIKAGQYRVSIIKCDFHSRKMPCIMLSDNYQPSCKNCCKSDCSGFNSTPHKGGDGGGLLLCPMIKPGNGVYHREDGSIIVGKYLAPGCLSHPKDAFDCIYDRIRKNAERGNEITLTIEERYPQPKPKELSNFNMGTQIINQMGGRPLNI